jgi:hypothetical protein
MEPEEPDYEAIWRWIIEDAEAHAEEWGRQAGWLEEAANFIASPEGFHSYAAQRRACKAHAKHSIQCLDLASAINKGDIASYIKCWHPQAAPNGPSVTCVTYDECGLTGLFHGTLVIYDEPEDLVNPAAIWRGYAARRRAKRKHQARPPTGYVVSSWQAGQDHLATRSRLRDWARRVLRRH